MVFHLRNVVFDCRKQLVGDNGVGWCQIDHVRCVVDDGIGGDGDGTNELVNGDAVPNKPRL